MPIFSLGVAADSKDRWPRPLTESSLYMVSKSCLISRQPHMNERRTKCDRGLHWGSPTGFSPFLMCFQGSANQALSPQILRAGVTSTDVGDSVPVSQRLNRQASRLRGQEQNRALWAPRLNAFPPLPLPNSSRWTES